MQKNLNLGFEETFICFLMEIANRYHYNIIDFMEKQDLLDLLNENYIDGQTPLMMACRKLDSYLVSNLVAAGVNINKKDYRESNAFLILLNAHPTQSDDKHHDLYEDHRYDIAKVLINAGADITSDNQILVDAIILGYLKIVELLISTGVKVNQRLTARGYTPFMIAVLSGEPEIINFLASKGADINQITKNRETALILAIKVGWDIFTFPKKSKRVVIHLLVKFLLSKKAKVNLSDKEGNSALIYAAKLNHFTVIKGLIASGAYLKKKNMEGKDFYDLLTNEKIKSWVFKHFPKFAKEKQRNLDAAKFGI